MTPEEIAANKVTLTQGTLDERIRYFLQDNYACTRVWEAWSYGTMTEDDFTPMEEDEDIVNDFKTLVQTEVDRATAAQDKQLKEKDKHIKRLGGVLPGSGHRHSQEDRKCEDNHKP